MFGLETFEVTYRPKFLVSSHDYVYMAAVYCKHYMNVVPFLDILHYCKHLYKYSEATVIIHHI